MSEMFPPDFGEQIGKAFNQVRGAMEEVMAERFEYVRVAWDHVNGLARDGWLLVPVNGGTYWPEGGWSLPAQSWFIMSRKLGPADDAARMLEQAAKTGDGYCTCTPEQAAQGSCGKPMRP